MDACERLFILGKRDFSEEVQQEALDTLLQPGVIQPIGILRHPAVPEHVSLTSFAASA